jgi:Molybdopterin oxidoreductase Fe4S4 domain
MGGTSLLHATIIAAGGTHVPTATPSGSRRARRPPRCPRSSLVQTVARHRPAAQDGPTRATMAEGSGAEGARAAHEAVSRMVLPAHRPTQRHRGNRRWQPSPHSASQQFVSQPSQGQNAGSNTAGAHQFSRARHRLRHPTNERWLRPRRGAGTRYDRLTDPSTSAHLGRQSLLGSGRRAALAFETWTEQRIRRNEPSHPDTVAAVGASLAPTVARAEELRIQDAKAVPSVCPYRSVGCVALVQVANGKILNIEGDPRSPPTRDAVSEGRGDVPAARRSEPAHEGAAPRARRNGLGGLGPGARP